MTVCERLARASSVVVASALAITCAGAEDAPSLTVERAYKLDINLQEASGLTRASPQSVFAHNDEYAIIHEIDVETGKTIRAFAFGKPTSKGDFEGIAMSGGSLWLVSSDGKLIEGRPAEHAERSRFNVFDTGTPKNCEVEGIAAIEEPGDFLLLCKASVDAEDKPHLRIFKWSLKNRWRKARVFLDIRLSALVPDGSRKDFRASDLAFEPKSGNLIVLNSNGGLLTITQTGGPVSYEWLDRKAHPQPEGLALLPDGRVAIADEGAKREGVLTIYRRAQPSSSAL